LALWQGPAGGPRRGIDFSAVFGIARSHDALLALDSRAGRGTSFGVYFPITVEGEPRS